MRSSNGSSPSSERLWAGSVTRRWAVRAFAAFVSGSPLGVAMQQDPFRDHSRVPKLEEMVTPFDFEAVAYAKLPRFAYDYTAYGADSEFTLRRNRQAFDWVKLVPGALGGGGAVPQTSLDLLGTKMAFPILVSPTAGHQALHPDGETATHQGASAAAGTPLIVSNVASLPFEKIAASGAAGPLWFQIYPKDDADANRELLEKVQEAGARAIVVTIDQQASVYERAQHDRHLGATGYRRPRGRGAPRNAYRVEDGRLWYEWKLLDQLRAAVKVPMVAKGILTAEDARLCLEHGMNAVYVSNHGGRSLDYGPSSLEVLPEIVDAVGGRVPVMFDSGVRRGADVLKALALGASAVCLGRLPRWGLGAYGAPGVRRMLEILQAELVASMRVCGVPALGAIKKTLVRTDFP